MSQYAGGTVSVTNGSTAIVGTGTKWATYAATGDGFYIVGQGVPYRIASVTDDTHATLSQTYGEATLSGLAYVIHTSRTANGNYPIPEAKASQGGGDVETATIVNDAITLIDRDLFAGTGTALNLASGSGTTGNLTAGRVTVTGSTVPVNGLYLPSANNPALAANSTKVIEWTSSAITASKPVTIASSSVNQLIIEASGYGGTAPGALKLINSSGAGASVGLQLHPSSGTGKYNWQIAAQENVNNALEITPSTASGGSTFSTPALQIAGATGDVTVAAKFTAGAPIHCKSYTVATVPSAGTASGLIYVSNESGGAVIAFSDGTNWRRVTDRAIVS